jgi:hypothetical protein
LQHLYDNGTRRPVDDVIAEDWPQISKDSCTLEVPLMLRLQVDGYGRSAQRGSPNQFRDAQSQVLSFIR